MVCPMGKACVFTSLSGGLGALHALGLRVRCTDVDYCMNSEPGIIFGRHLSSLETVSWPKGHPANNYAVSGMTLPSSLRYLLPDLVVEVACDVNNPFIGPNGATAVCWLRCT